MQTLCDSVVLWGAGGIIDRGRLSRVSFWIWLSHLDAEHFTIERHTHADIHKVGGIGQLVCFVFMCELRDMQSYLCRWVFYHKTLATSYHLTSF